MISREQQAALRRGRITGSIAQRIMTAASRSTWNTIAHDLRNPRPFYSLEDTPNMPEPLAWGQRHEPIAAGEFWDRHVEYDVLDPKFMRWHDPADTVRMEYFGYSPDRVLARMSGDIVGGLETKCPFDQQVHIDVLRGGGVPEWARWQVYHGMYVSGLPEWWFVSFDPRIQDADYRYFECRVLPHRKDMDKLIATLDEFLHGYSMGERFAPLDPKANDFDRMF